jgi:hypothetical protein
MRINRENLSELMPEDVVNLENSTEWCDQQFDKIAGSGQDCCLLAISAKITIRHAKE